MNLYLTMANVPKHDARGRLFESLTKKHRRKSFAQKTNLHVALGVVLLSLASTFSPLPVEATVWITWTLLFAACIFTAKQPFDELFDSGMMQELRLTPITPTEVMGELRAFALWLIVPLIAAWFIVNIAWWIYNPSARSVFMIQPMIFAAMFVFWAPISAQNFCLRVEAKTLRQKALKLQDPNYTKRMAAGVIVYILGIFAWVAFLLAMILSGWVMRSPVALITIIVLLFVALVTWFVLAMVRLRRKALDGNPKKKAAFQRELDELFIEAIERKAEKKRS